MELGTLETVPLREVWAHEAFDFSKWMVANAQLLSQELGVPFRLTHTETAVGSFRLDILGEDDQGRSVIVENQYGQTDHDHLGKIMTYWGGVNASVLIWVAERFRDEHKSALNRLNDATDGEVSFFGVEVRAVRIGDSAPAPVLEVVVAPSQWERAAKRAVRAKRTQRSTRRLERSAAKIAYWRQAVPLLHDAGLLKADLVTWAGKTSDARIAAVKRYTVGEVTPGVVYIIGEHAPGRVYGGIEVDTPRHASANDAVESVLTEWLDLLRSESPYPLTLTRLGRGSDSRVALITERDGGYDDPDMWAAYTQWFVDVRTQMQRLVADAGLTDLLRFGIADPGRVEEPAIQ